MFVFRDRATRRADVMAFYGDATSVRPLAFAATIKDIKSVSPSPSAITTGETAPLTNPLVWGTPASHLTTSIAAPMPSGDGGDEALG